MDKQLKIEKARLHIIEGLLVAHNNQIEIEKIRADRSTAKGKMIEKFSFSDNQTSAIMDLQKPLGEIKIESILAEKQRLVDEIDKLGSSRVSLAQLGRMDWT
nr:hypothetical protein [uncultured Desulfuromonas sp.]